jgi:hypothetical protein
MAIFGADDRTLVQTFGSPWKFAGRWSWNTVDGPFIASGVLIGAEYVLTAQHVFGMAPDSTFTPAYKKENGVISADYGTVTRDTSKPSSGYTDIALVHVNANSEIPVKDIPGMVLFLNPVDAVGEHVSSAGLSGGPKRRRSNVQHRRFDCNDS